MKRLNVIILLAIVLLSMSGAFPNRVFAADSSGAPDAVIRECSGNVEIKAGGDAAAGDWIPAKVGMPLDSKTLISTGFKSTALLAIGNSTVLVRSLTRLSLEELVLREGNEQVDLNLRAGRVRADVNPPSSGKTDFTIRSPTATASVRGTSFDFNAINLSVYSGKVAFTGRDNTTVVAPAGKIVTLDSQGRAAAPTTGAERQLTQVSSGATSGVPAPSGPVTPVVAGPNGTLTIPGSAGNAELTPWWRP
jgi:hypothetical protein